MNIRRLSTDRRQKTSLILYWIFTKCRFSHNCYGTILSTLKINPLRSQLRILGRSNLLLAALLLIRNDRLADIKDVMTLLFIKVLFWLLLRRIVVVCLFSKLVWCLNLNRRHLFLHLLYNIISIQKVDGTDTSILLSSLSIRGPMMRFTHIWLIDNARRFVSLEYLLIIWLILHKA